MYQVDEKNTIPNMHKTLTKRQKEVLDFVRKFVNKKDYPPTLEEMRDGLGLSAVSTVHQHIETLVEKGYLQKSENYSRAIELNRKNKHFTTIPLLGMISAGGPIEAIRNPEPIDVPSGMLSKNGEFYALKVRGNSMIDEGIFDNDVVVVRQQPAVDNGESAVAYLPDKDAITLKRVYQEKNRIKLVPANKKMKPFYEKSVEVQGKVVGVLRKYG
ncbi:MAG: transcriptional repressor LexA [Parcubacteria group bacterium]|nr:transcriptional repressor LexA [Parcubacteria group bacterium]